MFDKYGMRYKIALVWLAAFICLWTLLQVSYPLKAMKQQLDNIEQSIESKDWEKANYYTAQFLNTYQNKRFLVHINNSTEALITFEDNLGQLETTVKHNETSALEFIGALRKELDMVVKPFAAP